MRGYSPEAVGMRIWRMREKRGMSQEALAARLNKSLDELRDLEYGRVYQSREDILNLAITFNTSDGYFAHGEDEVPPYLPSPMGDLPVNTAGMKKVIEELVWFINALEQADEKIKELE